MTSRDFQLQKEHESIRECEKLVDKMDNVLHEDSVMKPTTVTNWNEFMLTGRLGASATNISSSHATLPLKK